MTISLEGLKKVYASGFQAVNNLDLQINDGEFFTLLGPSGCGKTTTLRMIAGLETASEGRVVIGGNDFTHTHPRERDVAMVFQSYALYPHMTVKQNLALNLQVKKVAVSEIEIRVAEVARMLGLEKLLDNKPGQLSGGQRQRVALGRAVIRRPNVFLMDEPLSNLDLKLRERTRTELKRLHERMRVTTVYVTHDQAEALVLSDRIGIMSGGDLLQVATPKEIYDRPCNIFVAKFVGTPSINLLSVVAEPDGSRLRLKLKKSGREIPGIILDAESNVIERLSAIGGELTLGVRPEAVAISSEMSDQGLRGAVDLVEPMGSLNHIELTIDGMDGITADGEPFLAVVRSNEDFLHGEPLMISIRPDRLVLFEAATGKTVAALTAERTWAAY